jgi:hypothetical protein
VPVSGPLRDRLAGYHAHMSGQPGWDWFFPGSRPGEPMTLVNVYHNFRRFLWQARISHGGRGHVPRVHDCADIFVMPTATGSQGFQESEKRVGRLVAAWSGGRWPGLVELASSAHASLFWYAGCGAERRTAPATSSLPAPGSRAVIRS